MSLHLASKVTAGGGEGGELTCPSRGLGQSTDKMVVATEVGGLFHILLELHGKCPSSLCTEKDHLELLNIVDGLDVRDLLLLKLARLALVKLQRLV